MGKTERTGHLAAKAAYLFAAQHDAEPETVVANDLEGVLIRKFGESQDGGLNGPTEEVRLLRSLAALLMLGLLGHSSQAGPFRILFVRLIAFVQSRLASIPDDNARRVVTGLVEAVKQGRLPDGPRNREFAEAVAPCLDVTKADWAEIARDWPQYLP